MVINLIPKTTDEYTSNIFTGCGKNNIGFCCNALQGSETITLQVLDTANNIWANAVFNGNTYQLSSTTNIMSIVDDTQIYRLVKTATSTAVGLDTVSDLRLGA